MNRILVLIDFAESNDALLGQAEMLGKALNGKLWLIHVAAPDPDFVGFEVGSKAVRGQVAKEFKHEHAQLHNMAEHLRAEGIETTALLIQGPTIKKISEEVNRLDIDLILAGLHRHGGVYRTFVGSVVDSLIAKAPCAIYLVPAETKSTVRAI